jgi:hypothetical protein
MGLTRAQRFNRFADRAYAQKAEWGRIAEETHRWGDYSYRDCMEYAVNYREHIEALAEEDARGRPALRKRPPSCWKGRADDPCE